MKKIQIDSSIQYNLPLKIIHLNPKIFKNRFSTKAPIFLWRPDLLKGIPIFLEILALKAEIPTNLFQENPPLFILHPLVKNIL